MTIFDLYHLFSRYFRPRRMEQFWKQFDLSTETRVLDVGGYEFNWSLLPHRCRVTFLNLDIQWGQSSNVSWVVGDGCCMPFKDDSFDVVYSNSVIEHLGNFENQHLFASECRRVGKRYYVQTPDKRFFVEPHLITPFIHWLPYRIQKLLLRNFTVWGWMTRPTGEQRDIFMNEIRLLDRSDLQTLFPDADIWHERFWGMSKSIISAKNSCQ